MFQARRGLSSLVLRATDSGVTTLTMNNPTKLNGWTEPMSRALFAQMAAAAKDPDTKVVVLTGADPYYCAGVDLAGTLTPMMPATLRRTLYQNNKRMFGEFLDFPKPIVAAVNGPAIGASVTTATLCDAIVASERATFNTPFARLGIPPEGCSSVHFARLMGQSTADRMLGKEGWVPTAKEAADVGLVTKAVAHETLLDEATALARSWIQQGDLSSRSHMGVVAPDEYAAVNDRESHDLADAFLSAKFLQAQADFLKAKGKSGPAATFQTLVYTRPLWSLLL